MNRRIFCLFIYSLVLGLVLPAVFPFAKINFLIPFLVYLFYHTTQLQCIWWAALCGFIFDSLSSYSHFGIFSANYMLTAWILYKQKFRFFEDGLSTLPLMTFFFSVLSTCLQVFFLDLFGQKIVLSSGWIMNDLLWLPFLDGIYAALTLTLPLLFLPKAPVRETRVIRFNR